MTNNTQNLRVISLRSGDAVDESFENILRNAGHKVTLLSSVEPAFALVNSNWPDLVLFDPVSTFGMSASVRRLRSNFNGPIVAIGEIPDPTITAMLRELGVTMFAREVGELSQYVNTLPTRAHRVADYDSKEQPEAASGDSKSAHGHQDRQLNLVNSSADQSGTRSDDRGRSMPSVRLPGISLPALSLPSVRNIRISIPMKRWHRTAIGTAVVAIVAIAVAVPFVGAQFNSDETDNEVAKALPVVPRLLTEPLAPLTIEELSGETLPLEIAGIRDRAVIEQPAIAFWGDTAPDAFVTVNGEPVDVSAYGAFVVDYPLEDGANFIEVLASDFQGRTSRKSFTVVSLQ